MAFIAIFLNSNASEQVILAQSVINLLDLKNIFFFSTHVKFVSTDDLYNLESSSSLTIEIEHKKHR